MINPFASNPERLRTAIEQACETTSTTNDPGKVADALVTYSQARALDFRTPIVRGGRGSGKSFWWSALQKTEHREWIVRSVGAKLSQATNMAVYPGFGNSAASAQFPSPRNLAELSRIHSDHLEDIWTAVLLKHISPADHPLRNSASWNERVQWVAENIEQSEAVIRNSLDELNSGDKHVLICFDALDLLADTWERIRPLAKSILRFSLGLQSHSRLRAKVFLRPDMLEDNQIWAFPDASKLRDSQARLDWGRLDLYTLFFQRLGNAEDAAAAEAFRTGTGLIGNALDPSSNDWIQQDEVWAVPGSLRSDEKAQREVFHALSGKAMSHNQSNVKRGYPYTWLPNHLADSHDEVSPRSFLSALREAAHHRVPHGSMMPLYFTGIQRGVAHASEIRVREITEDYPWVSIAMDPLRGQLNVPCFRDEVLNLWRNASIEAQLNGREETSASSNEDGFSPKLGPPKLISSGLQGLLEDLIRLGIFSAQGTERVQMPDVYRVAFGLGRRGGIPPMR